MLNLFALIVRIFQGGGQSGELWGFSVGFVGTERSAGGANLQRGCRVMSAAVPGTWHPHPWLCLGFTRCVCALQVPPAPQTARRLPWSSGRTTPAWCRGAARPPWSAWPAPGKGTPAQLSAHSGLSRMVFSFLYCC